MFWSNKNNAIITVILRMSLLSLRCRHSAWVRMYCRSQGRRQLSQRPCSAAQDKLFPLLKERGHMRLRPPLNAVWVIPSQMLPERLLDASKPGPKAIHLWSDRSETGPCSCRQTPWIRAFSEKKKRSKKQDLEKDWVRGWLRLSLPVHPSVHLSIWIVFTWMSLMPELLPQQIPFPRSPLPTRHCCQLSPETVKVPGTKVRNIFGLGSHCAQPC